VKNDIVVNTHISIIFLNISLKKRFWYGKLAKNSIVTSKPDKYMKSYGYCIDSNKVSANSNIIRPYQ